MIGPRIAWSSAITPGHMGRSSGRAPHVSWSHYHDGTVWPPWWCKKTLSCIMGSSPWCHRLTTMLAWEYHHNGMGVLPWGHPATEQPHIFPMTHGSFRVTVGLCQAPSHAKSPPSTVTGHSHPAPSYGTTSWSSAVPDKNKVEPPN